MLLLLLHTVSLKLVICVINLPYLNFTDLTYGIVYGYGPVDLDASLAFPSSLSQGRQRSGTVAGNIDGERSGMRECVCVCVCACVCVVQTVFCSVIFKAGN